jgi:hypothetical protein
VIKAMLSDDNVKLCKFRASTKVLCMLFDILSRISNKSSLFFFFYIYIFFEELLLSSKCMR